MIAARYAIAFATIFASAVAGAADDSQVVKQVLTDGSVLFTDRPVKGVRVERIKLASPVSRGLSGPAQNVSGLAPTIASTVAPSLPQLPPLPARSDLPGASAPSERLTASDSPLERARKSLVDALARQARGAEVREGERVHLANGRQRFSESFSARQADLSRAVDIARAELERQQR